MREQEELYRIGEMLMGSLNQLKESGISYIYSSKEEEISGSIGTTTYSLQQINDELVDCKRCNLCQGRQNIVFGTGNPNATLVFVGEGPGADEDRLGEPFVGRAGQLLTKMINAMGLKREDVYICNVVKCRPPENRDPKPEEIEACEPFLKKQLMAIKPQVIVGLGRHACQTLLKSTTPMSKIRGEWQEYDGIRFMPTFHPAYLLRNPPAKKEVWEDLKKVMGVLGLEQEVKS